MSKKGNRSTSASAAFVVVNIGELKEAHASGGGTVRADVLHPGQHHPKHQAMGKGSRSRSPSRFWLMEDDGTYKMICYGGHLEMEHDGSVVWKGKATDDGFETTSTSLPARKCATLLDLALVGEKLKYGAHSGPSRATGSEPVAKKSAAKKTASNKKAPKETAKAPTPKGPARYTDSNNPGEVLTFKALDYDNAKYPLDPRDAAAIKALAPGESYLPKHSGDGFDGDGRIWGTITRVSGTAKPAKPAAKKPTPKKPRAKRPAPKKTAPKKTAPKKTAPKKTAAAESKGVAAVETYTVSGQHGETVVRKDVRIQRPAGVSQKRIQGILDRLPSGKSRLSTVVKQLAKHGAAFVPWDDGKPGDSGAYETAVRAPAKTAPAPASGPRPSKRGNGADEGPSTSRSTDLVDDARFLDDLHAELKKAKAANLFETAKAIWLAGGRQKALEHMAATKGRSLVKAFLDWMDKHEQDAQAMLGARAS
jgi:hypothetical protein